MFAGTHLLLWQQDLLEPPPLDLAAAGYTYEIRLRFPGPASTLMPPTQLSGGIITVSEAGFGNGLPLALSFPLGATSASISADFWSLWYEKPGGATSATGNLYVTSSAGRVQITSASIFNDTFYNVAVVKEHQTGSFSLYVNQYINGALTYSTSSTVLNGQPGYPNDVQYTLLELGSSSIPNLGSQGQFWAQEFRHWTVPLTTTEMLAHADHFESYGRDASWNNRDLKIHWRLNDSQAANVNGNIFTTDSTLNNSIGGGSNFSPGLSPYTRFLLDFAYIPSIDYGWNQKKIRLFSGSSVEPKGLYRNQGYRDERFVSLEFNLVDALNEDLSHIMSSYDELIDFVGQPVNKYRESYEGLVQMRETYFKRLQGELNFRVFADMLDFFDRSFVTVVQRLLPARAVFKGDEFVVESHMLERPKYQYQLRPIPAPLVDVSGSVNITDLWGDAGR